jgi:RNA polymerase sigma factor (sigma-70 family)
LTPIADYFRRSKGVVQEHFGDDAPHRSVTSRPAAFAEKAVAQTERIAALRAALFRLSEDRREVLLDKYVRGLSYEEIAARRGKTTKAIESLLSRARQEVRDLLKACPGGYDRGDQDEGVPCHERSAI